ncbi:nitrogen regulatory protein P-II [bacterium BMS3Abin01]|nr:nitrogen regulatory protein P-II [bacterium BMS3Abin01]HDZ59612.1 P-II family nitrogen regulator [Actinomycetota bacterium]
MKEITAIIRTNKIQRTKDALVEAGYPSMTVKEVMGRGKQKGLQQELSLSEAELPDEAEVQVHFIPKRMLTLMATDDSVAELVKIITEVNQTGYVGDGKIIVSPLTDAARVRTGELGDSALT